MPSHHVCVSAFAHVCVCVCARAHECVCVRMHVCAYARMCIHAGKKRGVYVNTVAPIAASRLTATVMPEDVLAKLRPEYVAGLVAFLSHESSTENGGLFEVCACVAVCVCVCVWLGMRVCVCERACVRLHPTQFMALSLCVQVGGGWIGKLRRERSGGVFLTGDVTPEQVQAEWGHITAFDDKATPALSNGVRCHCCQCVRECESVRVCVRACVCAGGDVAHHAGGGGVETVSTQVSLCERTTHSGLPNAFTRKTEVCIVQIARVNGR